MQKLNSLFLFLFALGTTVPLPAQNGSRYLDPVFDAVKVTTNVEYGINATVLFAGDPQVGQAIPEKLILNLYEPDGDDETARPLVILMHSGNFLPIVRNADLTGTRTDSVIVELANRLAKMGYVVACIDNRLGWNALAETQADRTLQLLQAAYRGIQDCRTAIRFFRRNAAENNNAYRIDPDRIVAWGVGTGGYISLGAAIFDNYLKVFNTTPEGKFLTPSPLDPNQQIPMVIEPINGDINGLGVGILPFPVPPLPAGDTLNYPNHPGYSSSFNLSVNMGGAAADINWLNAGQPPMITFQAPLDPYAPYEDAVLIVPTTGDPVVQVQGGKLIIQKANDVGNQKAFHVYEKEGTEYNIKWKDKFSVQAEESSAIAGHDYFEGLYPIIRPPNPNPNGNEEGSPWNWWNPNATQPGYPVPWNLLPHPTDPTGQTSYHTYALRDNPDMSPEKGRRYIDTIIGYFAPRGCLALKLDCGDLGEKGYFDLETSVALLSDQQVNLQIHPNPANDLIRITTGNEFPIQDVLVFDLNGRPVQSNSRINANTCYLNRGYLPSGIYVVKLRFKEGVLTKKIMFAN